MYEKIRGAGRVRRDWKLGLMITGAAVLLLLLALPLFFSGRLLYGFHRFTEEAAASFVYGEREHCLTARYEDDTWFVPDSGAGRLYAFIVRNGAGRPQKRVPEEEGLCLDFGDGNSLWFYPVPFDGAARIRDTGVLLRYERADGSVYAYDTDKLQMEDVLDCLRA